MPRKKSQPHFTLKMLRCGWVWWRVPVVLAALEAWEENQLDPA